MPHLGLWCTLERVDPTRVEAVTRQLVELVDRVTLEANGLQAFIASWDWAPVGVFNAQATPYERVCGVLGQCTTGRSWCNRFVRGVSERMWLGPELLTELGGHTGLAEGHSRLTTLGPKLVLRAVGEGVALELSREVDLMELEKALAPLLPKKADYKAGQAKLYGW